MWIISYSYSYNTSQADPGWADPGWPNVKFPMVRHCVMCFKRVNSNFFWSTHRLIVLRFGEGCRGPHGTPFGYKAKGVYIVAMLLSCQHVEVNTLTCINLTCINYCRYLLVWLEAAVLAPSVAHHQQLQVYLWVYPINLGDKRHSVHVESML